MRLPLPLRDVLAQTLQTVRDNNAGSPALTICCARSTSTDEGSRFTEVVTFEPTILQRNTEELASNVSGAAPWERLLGTEVEPNKLDRLLILEFIARVSMEHAFGPQDLCTDNGAAEFLASSSDGWRTYMLTTSGDEPLDNLYDIAILLAPELGLDPDVDCTMSDLIAEYSKLQLGKGIG
jgi:hypothetical protein